MSVCGDLDVSLKESSPKQLQSKVRASLKKKKHLLQMTNTEVKTGLMKGLKNDQLLYVVVVRLSYLFLG